MALRWTAENRYKSITELLGDDFVEIGRGAGVAGDFGREGKIISIAAGKDFAADGREVEGTPLLHTGCRGKRQPLFACGEPSVPARNTVSAKQAKLMSEICATTSSVVFICC